MSTVLTTILTALKEGDVLQNQKELADALNLTKGHVSTLMKYASELPTNVRTSLHKTFKIDPGWLASNGQDGQIWGDNGMPKDLPGIIAKLLAEKNPKRAEHILAVHNKTTKKPTEILAERQNDNEAVIRLLKLLEQEKADNARLTATVENLSKTVGELTAHLNKK